MSEYIEREAIKYEQWPVGPLYEPIMVVRKKTIDNIPAADVAPVRHGYWVECDWLEPDGHGGHVISPKDAVRCSRCRYVFKKELLWKDNFCPYCGSKMDLE